ncbi:MAG: GH116 family glycosyl hydrolase [Sphingomonadales bacterium]
MPLPAAALRIAANTIFAPQRVKQVSVDPARRGAVDADAINAMADLGMPLGGIGTGAMVWSRFGGFTRWSLKAGYYKHFREPACGFAVRVQAADGAIKASALQPPPDDARQLSAWTWADRSLAADYAALFPKSWRDYAPSDWPISFSCEAFSPLIPGNLQASSLPVALFCWRVRNDSDQPLTVSLLAHWANLCGWFHDHADAAPKRRAAGAFNQAVAQGQAQGIIFDRLRRGETLEEGDGQFALMALAGDGQSLSRAVMLDGRGDGAALWRAFHDRGDIDIAAEPWIADAGFRAEEPALPMGALCLTADLAPGQSQDFVFALSWDLPRIRFGLGKNLERAHTAQWSNEGKAAAAMAAHALDHRTTWSKAIDAWHDSAMRDFGPAPWQAGFALNELYFIIDGCTVLTAPDVSGQQHFGLLECPDYPYYNTLDLWVYASESVLHHWPQLEALVLADYARAAPQDDARQRKALYSDARMAWRRAGYLPHDLGAPEESPFDLVNSYTLQDSTHWKDLNSQFVLALWRAGTKLGQAWLRPHYGAARLALEALAPFDRDGDGLIENDGFPDQTFDNIPMRGPSSYCGGLWLAALAAGARMAAAHGEQADAERWTEMLTRGRQAFDDKLWAGDHYRVDTDGPMGDALFLEQLFGPFLARRYGLGDLLPPQRARAALLTLFQRSFIEAGAGKGPVLLIGASNAGLAEAAKHGDNTVQIGEVIVGTAMSFAAQLRCWGLAQQADQVRQALYHELYEVRGLFFRTPAAFETGRNVYRAPLNLRPLAIWLDSRWTG